MMKTNFKLLATFLLSIVVLASCVQDDDFDIPNTAPQEVNLDGQVIGIGAVQADFVQAQDFFYNEDTFNFFTYDDESDDTATYMEGYVISSDEGGNFFEEIILQDKKLIENLLDYNLLTNRDFFKTKYSNFLNKTEDCSQYIWNELILNITLQNLNKSRAF